VQNFGKHHIEDWSFYNSNKDVIDDVKKNYEYLDENKIIHIFKIFIVKGKFTIFELMNEIHRENVIQKNENTYKNINYKANNPKFLDKIQIFDKDEIDETKFIIDNYKTKPSQSYLYNINNNNLIDENNFINENHTNIIHSNPKSNLNEEGHESFNENNISNLNANKDNQYPIRTYNNLNISNNHDLSKMNNNTNNYANRSFLKNCNHQKNLILNNPEQMLLYNTIRERRRKIKKDINANLNYVPKLCEEHKIEILEKDSISNDDCHYSHNNNEILYHLLNYKTELCSLQNCEDPFCTYAHNLGKEFRIIYDYKKQDIISLMIKIENSNSIKNLIVHYSKIYKIPDNFSLDTYKVSECMLGDMCGKDPHVCYNYHDKKEKRRPPNLFKITGNICSFAQPERNSDFYPNLCQNVFNLISITSSIIFFKEKNIFF